MKSKKTASKAKKSPTAAKSRLKTRVKAGRIASNHDMTVN